MIVVSINIKIKNTSRTILSYADYFGKIYQSYGNFIAHIDSIKQEFKTSNIQIYKIGTDDAANFIAALDIINEIEYYNLKFY